MSWLYSRALVEAFSAGTCSGGGQSAPSSETPTPQAYLSPDKMTDFCRPSRFGMTFAPLTADLGEALLTWFLAGFHAKTLARQELGPESQEIALGCGEKWLASLAKFDPDSRSWRTRQLSLLGGSALFSETWPRWGMMRDGECWALATPALIMPAKESGFWHPTPLKAEPIKLKFKAQSVLKCQFGTNINSISYWTLANHGRCPSADLASWMMGWPIGWASLRPLATARFRQWSDLHGRC
jgi:hypothetical protein